MSENNYTNRYMSESIILNPHNRSAVAGGLQEGDVRDLEKNILLLVGGDAQEGKYYNGDANEWKLARIPILKNLRKELEEQFTRYKQEKVNRGDREPKEWPGDLLDQRLKLEARMKVAETELIYLRERLEEAKSTSAMHQETPCLPKNRMSWGAAETTNGIITKIGGQKLSLNKDGILFIDDERSKYNGMLVWKFKLQILKAIGMEESYRIKQMTQKALREGTKRMQHDRVKDPVYDPKTGKVTYPGYSDKVIKRITSELK